MVQTQADEYVYSNLDSDYSLCRTILLSPGAFTDEIVVVLRTRSLHKDAAAEPYDAISYVWGDPQDRQKVYVVSQQMIQCTAARKQYIWVTRNLVSALRHLRNSSVSIALWAVAICINQEDVNERAQQVQIMPTIFSAASYVWVWLSEEVENSTLAIDYIRWWNSKVEWDYGAKSLKMKDANDPDIWMADNKYPLPYSTAEVKACEALMGRSWFERTWVRQEIFWSTGKATIVCGLARIPWLDFCSGVAALNNRFFPPEARVSYSKRAAGMEDLIALRDNEPALFQLMIDVRRTKCLNPRDKIYAILGMIRANPDF